MLESGLMVAAFALLPALVSRFGFATHTSWRIASAVFLLISIPFEFLVRSRTKSMPDMTLTRLNINTINWCLSLGADLIMLVVLLGLVGSRAGAFYLLGIFALLIMTGLLFVQFAASTFVPSEQ